MPENPLLRWIVRFRWVFFLFVGVLLVGAYNGQWRVGRDSAEYRQVARNLAEGRGYTFRGEREQHIYPGLPYLLAGIDRVFGKQDALSPRAAMAIMASMGRWR